MSPVLCLLLLDGCSHSVCLCCATL